MINGFSRKYHPLPVALVLLGLLAASFVLMVRHRVESGNRAVELAVDYTQLRELGAAMGVPPARALQQLAGVGVTGVILNEETPADLESDGALEIRRESVPGPDGRRVTLTRARTDDPAIYDRLHLYLANKLRTP